MPRAILAQSAQADRSRTMSSVSDELGVSPSTLRTWERRYGLGPAQREVGERRRYQPEDVDRLRAMIHHVRAGMSAAVSERRRAMSRGLQNCNPGNIRQSKVRYKGEVRPSRDSAFKQFESLAWGYRAIFVLLDTYRIRYGLDTIRGMISRWAPPSENHTETYIRAVADAVGIPDGQPLDTRDRTTMLRMAAAVSRVENGAAADMGEVELGWELFVRDKPASG